MPPALALGAGVNALAVARSLGRRGIRVQVGDGAAEAARYAGRYGRPLALPPPEADPERLTDRLLQIAARAEVVSPTGARLVVLPCGDEWVKYLDSARQALWQGGVRFALPESRLLRDLLDKEATYRRAEAHGCPYPQAYGVMPDDATARRAWADSLAYPVLLKPLDSRAFSLRTGVKAVRCDSAADVEAAARRYAAFGPLLGQRFIPGGDADLLTVGVYRTLDGRVAGVFTGHKLRQHPEGAGVCSLGESLEDHSAQDATRLALALLENLGFVGVAQVEFKRLAATGELFLMEVNPRTWSWHGLTALCGVDLTWLCYRDLVGLAVEPARQTAAGWWWFAALDLRTSWPRLRGGRLGVGAYLKSLPPFRGGRGMYALFAWDDPLPALRYVVTLARRQRPKAPPPNARPSP
jgi:D-aspartate ligase